MAGTQPDVPGTKFHLDLDGTYGQYGSAGLGWTSLTGTQLKAMGNGVPSTDIVSLSSNQSVTLLFPEMRDVTAFSVAWVRGNSGNYPSTYQVSNDTTDGVNGTWNTVYTGGEAGFGYNASAIFLRQTWQIINSTSVRGFRMNTVSDGYIVYLRELSLYGSYTPSGLAFWHPTIDVQVGATYFDFGDLNQSSTYTKTFRIKNLHGTQTANNITLAADQQNSADAYNTTTFSLDGTNFAATQVIASLAAGATTSVMTVRRAVGSSESLSLPNTVRYTANVQTWT